MNDYQATYLNQQLKQFHRGKPIYVCSYGIVSLVEKYIIQEKVKYEKRKVFNSESGVVMYSFTKKCEER